MDPRTGTNTIAYAADGRVAWQEDAAGSRTTYGYDPATGRRIAVADALSNVVHTLYDLQGRVTNTWGATYPVGYEYDALGRMTAMHTWRDENGAPDTTRWNYDPATGQLTNKVYADGLGPQYAYDPAGRLAQRTWARGVETDYTYDALGQLASIDYSDDTPDVAFTYDRQGRPLTVTDILGTRTNVYDALNLLEERFPGGDALVRSYDVYGRAAGIALGADYAVGYGYDEYGRFSTVAVSNGATFTYSYVPDSSLLAGYTNDLGLAVAYEYEPHRDVKTLVSNAWGTNTISTFTYTYDALGRRTVRIDDGTTTNLFGYNLRSELVSAEMGTNTYAYDYDPIGNRTETVENGITTTYAANSLNQYTALNPSSPDPTPFTYDPDGNMTSDGTFFYQYDAANQLTNATRLSDSANVLSCRYDALGRRVEALREDGTTDRYVYFPGSFLVLAVLDENNALKEFYTHGLDLSGTLDKAGGIGGILSCTYASGLVHYHYADIQGNIIVLADSGGNVESSFLYAPFGQLTSLSNLAFHRYLFSSKELDVELELNYYGHRYYSTKSGRWLTRDAIHEAGGLNLYEFVLNNPHMMIDSWGDMGGFPQNACCCEGKILQKSPVDTGVRKVCRLGRNVGIQTNAVSHCWLEWEGGSAGFWPGGEDNSGKLESPDPYPDKELLNDKPTTEVFRVRLSPCEYNITTFKQCIANAVNDTNHKPYDTLDSFAPGWENIWRECRHDHYDCRDWPDDYVARCKTDAQGCGE